MIIGGNQSVNICVRAVLLTIAANDAVAQLIYCIRHLDGVTLIAHGAQHIKKRLKY